MVVWAQMWALCGAAAASAQVTHSGHTASCTGYSTAQKVTQPTNHQPNPPTAVLSRAGGIMHQQGFILVPEEVSRKSVTMYYIKYFTLNSLEVGFAIKGACIPPKR